MHFFRNKNRPRSSFDLKVGRSHLLEVTVHLVTHRRDTSHRKKLHRNKDNEWDWYNAHREEIHAEFLELLEATVLSRMFGTQLEGYHRIEHPSSMPREKDDIGGVASKNKTNRKRKVSKKQAVPREDDGEDKKQDKDIYFAFGELIQLAYKKEPIGNDNASHTILFRSKEDSTPEGSFRDRRKLQDRLLVWIRPAAASETSTEGVYRPDMIPISSLFRKPKEFQDFSNHDDDSVG